MGIFATISEAFNEGRERARRQSEAYRLRRQAIKDAIPVKLIEPSTGRIVKLQVTEKKDSVSKLYLDQLTTYAKSLEQYGVQWKVIDKGIQLIFANSDEAEDSRQTWKR